MDFSNWKITVHIFNKKESYLLWYFMAYYKSALAILFTAKANTIIQICLRKVAMKWNWSTRLMIEKNLLYSDKQQVQWTMVKWSWNISQVEIKIEVHCVRSTDKIFIECVERCSWSVKYWPNTCYRLLIFHLFHSHRISLRPFFVVLFFWISVIMNCP